MSVNPELAPSAAGQTPKRGWGRWVARILFALFTYAVGLFLVVFPWTDFWIGNYFQETVPVLRDIWYEPSFRGAVTGLGFVNIYIACVQVVYSLRRT